MEDGELVNGAAENGEREKKEGDWKKRRGSLEFFNRTRVLGVLKAERASPVLGCFAPEQP